MFEPQDHPNDFPYPGGPPNRPYDTTGWTLAFQMGVHFDRYTEPFTGPFAPIKTDLAVPVPGTIAGVSGTPAGYLVSHEYNDTYTLTNRLLKANQPVYWLKGPVAANSKQLPPGALWLPYSTTTAELLQTATKTLGINASAVPQPPPEQPFSFTPPASRSSKSTEAPCPRAGSAGSSISSSSPSPSSTRRNSTPAT